MRKIHNAVPLSGGGAALNFEVVGGTTEPTNPKENTIWVNTDTAIGEWQFSAVEPTTRADGSALAVGDVWVRLSDIDTIPINASKKNGLWIYPQSTVQWDGSAWVNKETKVYKNGEWLKMALWLLNGANLYTDITGGWAKSAGNSLSVTTTGVKVVLGTNWYTTGATKNAIDFGAATTLYETYYYKKAGSATTYAEIGTQNAKLKNAFSGSGTITRSVDISKLTGADKLHISITQSGTDENNGGSWFELREIYAV